MNKEKLNKLKSISKQIVSEFFCEKIKDSDNIFWIITITKVKISTDLSYLDVYVSCFENSEKLTKTLAQYAFKIQKTLNDSLNIRKIPRVRFRYDESSELTYKIEEEINKYCKY